MNTNTDLTTDFTTGLAATTNTARRNRNRLGLKVLLAGAGVLLAAGAMAPHAGATTPAKPVNPGIDGPVIVRPPVTLPTTTTTKGKVVKPIDPCKLVACPEPPLTADPGCRRQPCTPPPPIDPCKPLGKTPRTITTAPPKTIRTIPPKVTTPTRPDHCTPPTTTPEPGGSSSSGTAKPADVVKANPTFTG